MLYQSDDLTRLAIKKKLDIKICQNVGMNEVTDYSCVADPHLNEQKCLLI